MCLDICQPRNSCLYLVSPACHPSLPPECAIDGLGMVWLRWRSNVHAIRMFHCRDGVQKDVPP